MAEMGKYCKAYPITRFREFGEWQESSEITNLNATDATSGESADADGAGEKQDYYFLQENYTVTTGIFLDEGIVFDQVTDKWIDFCLNSLKFKVPTFDTVQTADSAAASSSSA
jgi:hypothetical protein